jgi:hypothetical protein
MATAGSILIGLIHCLFWLVAAGEDLVSALASRTPLRWLYDVPVSELVTASEQLEKVSL